MKVVFVTLFKEEEFGGGEGRVAHELAQHFAAHHDTVLMCPADATGLSETECGLKEFGIRSAGEGNVYFTALSGRNVHRIFTFLDEFRPDVVHAHDPASLGLIAQVWARMYDVPFVYTAHVLPSSILDFGAVEVARILKSALTESMARQVLSNFYENCDALIALNRYCLDSIREFGYDGRVVVIPNGRDLSKYGACRNTDTSSPERVLTFVGHITRRKNQRYLLEMLRHLPEHYTLQIIGESLDPAFERELKDLAAEYGLDNIMFTGHVPHQAIPAYLEKTHVFVSASKMEVQSLVVIEALASGTPVIGLSNETIDELVDDGVGCWLPKDADPEEFARCVQRICDASRSEYDHMCRNARDRVKGLDYADVVAQTTVAYESLSRERSSAVVAKAERNAGLRQTISLMPPGEVRDFLTEQVAVLERTIQERIGREPRLKLAARIEKARRVPGSSWFYVGLTILVSLIGYVLLRQVSAVSRVRKARAII
jgi:1,2-diacylglycerol 3-alpha-glucosyltransferase